VEDHSLGRFLHARTLCDSDPTVKQSRDETPGKVARADNYAHDGIGLRGSGDDLTYRGATTYVFCPFVLQRES
jgi:hypothetical protein